MTNCTIVTAFYPIKSKYNIDIYYKWADNFMQLKSPIILFTDSTHADYFRNIRGALPIHIIIDTFEDMYMWKKYKEEWIKHHELDWESNMHTPELYAIWANKVVWVDEATRLNPFDSTHFFWCDIGAFRDESIMSRYIDNFPIVSLFPESDILFSSVEQCTPDDYNVTWMHNDKIIIGDFTKKNRIVGGLWGGTKGACKKWRELYEGKLLDYFDAGRFAGKDQSVMVSAILESGFGTVIQSSTYHDWFFLQEVLCGYKEQIIDKSFIKP